MALTLHRVPGTKLFINVAPGQGAEWERKATFCFYHYEDTDVASIEFANTKNQRGTYAFLPPNALAPFNHLADQLARVTPLSGHRLLWLAMGWQKPLHELAFAEGKALATLDLSLWKFSTLSKTGLGSSRLSVNIPMGASVVFMSDHLVVEGSGIDIVTSTIDDDDLRLSPVGKSIELRMESGPRCATVTGKLDPTETAKWIGRLAPQVRYMWRRNNLPVIKPARILSQDLGDFTHVGAEFQLQSFSADREVTRIDLVAEETTAKMVSFITDTRNQIVALQPLQGDGVHGANIGFEQSGNTGTYASLSGKFKIVESDEQIKAGSVKREVMPGRTGTEFFQLELDKDGFDGLEFFPGMPALVEFAAGSRPTILKDDFTTAWIAPCCTGETAGWATKRYGFVSQSEDEPLYSRRNIDDTGSVYARSEKATVLFDPAPSPVPEGTCLPFFPFPGIQAGMLAETNRLDVEALAPERSRIVAEARQRDTRLMAMTTQADHKWATTPQGLLVEIDSENNWHKIKLGEGPGWEMTIDRPKTGDQPVARWALQEALSRSEVFVVISRRQLGNLPSPEEPALGDIKLNVIIGGWPLAVNLLSTSKTALATDDKVSPLADSGFAPVLILKLSKGSLRDMLLNVGRWALPRLFNEDPEVSSKGAYQALVNLETLSEGRSSMARNQAIAPELKGHYAALFKKITDPNWTGILVLNAHVPMNGIPSQLAVLTEGLGEDGSGSTSEDSRPSFGLPVLGLDLSRVVPEDNGLLRLDRTSAFGAVHYHSPTPLDEKKPGFDFKVLTLNAIFDNSELRTFLTSMQLRLGSFFGADTVPSAERLVDIVCRYEDRPSAAGEPEYTFRALGARTMAFTGNAFLDKLTINRIDLTCDKIKKNGKEVVQSRFGFWGLLEFGESFSKVTGIRKIEYENAALVMTGSEYGIDVGNVRVDFKKEGSSIESGGLLAKFPFKLSGMRWASLGQAMKLSDIGFTPISLPEFPVLKAPSFDFALELALNLGSMGKLFEGAEFLKASILIGWYKSNSGNDGFSIGFRFEGGSGPLDIGVNGVMRLTADAVNLQTYQDPPGIGIGLINPQLDVMGYKVPAEPRDTLVAFLPSSKSNVAWAWARLVTNVGPVTLNFFAIGQRMHLVKPMCFDSGATLSKIVQCSKDTVRPVEENGVAKLPPNIGELYTEEAGWGVVADGEVGAFKFKFVFLDGLNRYGLGLTIPNIADVDVLYRKLSDGMGVFSGEIVPAYRTLEMGAATVTLPILGFDALTNGNWSLNIGYHGNDFSRGTTVQLLPFLGSGGIRFGKQDWRSSYVLNSDPKKQDLIKQLKPDPVIEMSMAMRVGIGKVYSQGVFAAGISLSLYGIFEGAFGYPTDPGFPPKAPRRYIKLSGTAGLLLEILGVANFAVVSAAVSIRVWVETGLTLESWTAVIVHAEAGVSVHVRFVIARFKIFGKRIEIAIHFSFATRVRFTQELPYSFDGANPYTNTAQVARLAREAALLEHQATEALRWTPHEWGTEVFLPTAVTLEPMLGENGLVMLPMLFASDTAGDTAFSVFTVRLFLWALRLSKGVASDGPMPDKVKLTELSALCCRVSPPKGTSLARWGDKPLNFEAFKGFALKHLRLKLMTNVEALLTAQKAEMQAAGLTESDTAQGILLPWFADITISAEADDIEPVVLRDFRGTHSRIVDEAWEQALFDNLSKAVPDLPLDEREDIKRRKLAAGLHALQKGGKEALDAITEDWVAALVQGITQRALLKARELVEQSVEGAAPEVKLDDLVTALLNAADGGSLAAQVGKHASTFLHHGLRVPEQPGDTTSVPLSQFLRTELSLSEFAAAKEWTLHFISRQSTKDEWITGAAQIEKINMPGAAGHLNLLVKDLQKRKVKLTAYLEESDLDESTQPRRFVADALVPLGRHGTRASSLRTVTVHPALSSLARRRKVLKVVPSLEAQSKDGQRTSGQGENCPARWFVKIDVQLEANNSDKQHPICSVRHIDARVRKLLGQMREASQPLVRKVRLAYKVKDATAAIPLEFLEQDEVFIFVSNLSKEPRPPSEALSRLTRSDTPTFATLVDADKLVEILWMASSVNAPGFNFGFKGVGNPIKHLFEEAAVAVVSLLFELNEAPTITSLVDGLLVDEALVNDKHVVSFTTPEVRESLTATPDGQVAIIVERVNPLHGIKPTTGEDEADLRYLMGRFELVDYGTKLMDRGSVIPTRLIMDEEELASVKEKKIDEQPLILRHRILVPVAKLKGESNPYRAVGTDVKDLVHIGLRDGAGHVLDESALDLQWMAGRPTRLLYRDTLLRLQELPGVTANWHLEPQGQDAAIKVALRWSAENLFSSNPSLTARELEALVAQQREALVAVFQRAWYTASTEDFSANLEVKLAERKVAAPRIEGEVSHWLQRVIEQISTKEDKPQDLELTAIIPNNVWPSTTPIPVRLKVAVIFRRKADLCDQRMLDHDHNGTVSDKEKDASEIATAYSPILPASLQKPTDWKAWAGNVQVAFGKAFSLLRRLETDADTDEDMQPERSQGSAVWLMRRSMLTKAETKATVSSFYAPAPLAIALRSGQVQVPLATGGSTEINARDIDLNAIAANAVGTLERLVSQTVGASLCQWQPGLYSRLALAKRDVADAMAGRLESILKNGSNLPEDAKKKFLNACREDTRTSFAPVAVVNAHLTPAATGRTFLWGTVNIAAPNVKPEELSFSFSPVSIPLGANGIEGSFDFVVQWAGLSVTPPAVVSGLMIVRPQYVQVTGDNTGDKDIIGYIPSDWYEVIWSDELGGEDMAKITVLTNTGPEWDIPLPLRLIPPTPTILRHGHQPGVPEDADDLDGYIRKARYWEYGVSVMVPAMDHDTTEVTMRFSDAAKLALLAHDPLFEVLVAYNHHAQAIDAVANELVATGKANENNLKFAIDLFEHVAEALAARAKYSTTLLPPHEDVRVVKLRTKRRSPDPRQPLPAEISWTVFPLGHQQDVETALRSLPEEKDGDDILKPDATDSTKGIARYEPGRPLAEAAIIGVASLSPRHVSLSNLDVMVQGRAMPTVLARRNADLLVGKGKDIAPDFIFETPLRGAPDALVPRLAHIKRFDLSKGTPPQPIHSWLLKLYQALVRDADADKFAFDVSARIRLPLVRDRNTVIESFIPQAAVKSAPASERDWIATLAGHYLAAIKVLSTQARQEGELEIKVQVFTASMGDSHKPVLSLTGLYLPLAKVTDDGVTPFVRTNQLALHQVAAYVFERTRCMTAEAAAAYREAFAIDAVRDPDEVVAAYLPSPAELASMEGREAWVAALQAAEAALTLTD